ncbi:MAG: helix-turn-helix domain-containing protein [Sandaracinaceae bacterium]|nr:helix-turn-helix domain-containing protein [Sandaracinaceae bacterium]
MPMDVSHPATRVLGENGLAFLSELHAQRANLTARWFESDELLEAYVVLESHIGELAPVIARIEQRLPTLSPERLPSAYAWLGHLLTISGSRERASHLLAEAEARCQSSWLRAHIVHDRAVIANTEKLPLDAERELLLAVELYEACGDPTSAADAAVYAAQAYCARGKGSEALDLVLGRLDSVPRGGVLELRASLELARAYRERVEIERMAEMIDRAEQLAPTIMFDPSQRIAFHHGEIAWWREDWPRALAHFRTALDLTIAHARPLHEASTRYALALVAFDARDFDGALASIRSTIALAQTLSHQSLLTGARGVEACVLAALGDREAALKAYRSLRPTNTHGVSAVYVNGMTALAELLLAALAQSDAERSAFEAAARRNIETILARDELGTRWLERNFALRVLGRRLLRYTEPSGMSQLLLARAKPIAVDVDGSHIDFDNGDRISLSRRYVLMRVLACLARNAGHAVTIAELFEAGWPNDRASESALLTRLRVAVATLRQMGLDENLVTHANGYSLTL